MGIETIAIHPNSSLVDDVLSIVHYPDSAAVLVDLRKDGHCPFPYLRARLSGPALVILDWNIKANKNENVNTLVGSYKVPLAGKYFLDIQGLFCHDFLAAQPQTWNNSVDFAETCTEPAYRRQLTSDQASIRVIKAANSNEFSNGYWKIRNKQPDQQLPLYTRFQPPGCFHNREPRCNPPITSVQPFDEYELTRSLNQESSILEPKSNLTVCLLGSSHARKMYDYLSEYKTNNTQTSQNGQSNLKIVYHDVRMPFQVTGQMSQQLIHTKGCKAFVISVGQWASGKRFRIHKGRGPMTFSQYYDEIKGMLTRLHDALPSSFPIFVRSINYNPLGSMIGDCVPTDWRSPIVIDGYNSAMQHVVEEMNVPSIQYIDTNFLVGPVWDAASDWCHLDERVAVSHGLFVLGRVLDTITSVTMKS